MTERAVRQEIEAIRPRIPWQTYKTLLGQVRAGDAAGAALGIERLKKRIAREEQKHENCNR